MKVSDWLRQHSIKAGVVQNDWSLEQVMEKLLSNSRLKDLYVLDSNNQVIGHLRYKKLAKLALAEHCVQHTRSQLLERLAPGLAVDLMEAHFASAKPDESLDAVIHRQLEHWATDLRRDSVGSGRFELSKQSEFSNFSEPTLSRLKSVAEHWVEDLPVINQQGELMGVINLSDILLEVMKAEG
jgi:CBS-domain-containing membrane protein